MAIQILSPSEIISFGVALCPLMWINFSSNSFTRDFRGYLVSRTSPSEISILSLVLTASCFLDGCTRASLLVCTASKSAAVTVHKISSGRCVFLAISISFLRAHCLVAYSSVASLVEPLDHVYWFVQR